MTYFRSFHVFYVVFNAFELSEFIKNHDYSPKSRIRYPKCENPECQNPECQNPECQNPESQNPETNIQNSISRIARIPRKSIS